MLCWPEYTGLIWQTRWVGWLCAACGRVRMHDSEPNNVLAQQSPPSCSRLELYKLHRARSTLCCASHAWQYVIVCERNRVHANPPMMPRLIFLLCRLQPGCRRSDGGRAPSRAAMIHALQVKAYVDRQVALAHCEQPPFRRLWRKRQPDAATCTGVLGTSDFGTSGSVCNLGAVL